MPQLTFSIRMDENLKKQFDAMCSEFGMTVSTAITIYAKAVVRERKIPFEIAAPQPDVTREDGLRALISMRETAKSIGLQGMPLDEINAEIQSTRMAAQEGNA